MEMNKTIVLILFLVALLTLTVASQVRGNDTINIEEGKTCNTVFYNEVQDVYEYITKERNLYGKCLYYFNSTNCLNTSGAYTNCIIDQTVYNISCVTGTESYQSYEKTGTETVLKNRTECVTNKLIVYINKGSTVEKKEVDFSSWGPCIYNTENNCLIVTCVSNDDGAFKGQFTDCNGGKSCQKFRICNDEIKVFYKNSREDFVEYDPTFYLDKLIMKEVSK